MNNHSNVINHQYINYIVNKYVPSLKGQQYNINIKIFIESMLHVTTKKKSNDYSYERLEYLGDAVYHLVITEYLYNRFPDEKEGFLTRMRIRIEKGDTMVQLANVLESEYFVQLGKTELKNKILEDVFESFIGAFYINFGMDHVKTLIINLIEKSIDFVKIILHDDNYKDLLLRYFHQMKWGNPEYNETKKNDKFVCTVKDPNGNTLGCGISSLKKRAEQSASQKALVFLNVIINGEIDLEWLDKIDRVESVPKEKNTKKKISVYNVKNCLITKKIIKQIFQTYTAKVLTDNEINLPLFIEALTHRSYTVRRQIGKHTEDEIDKIQKHLSVKLQKKSNERLRFLGDAVIHFIIGDLLYNKYIKNDEGFLTRLRCKLENRDTLYYLGKSSTISKYLLVSQHIEILHSKDNVNIVSCGFEAFIGAIFIGFKLKTTIDILLNILKTHLNIDRIAEQETNYKDLITQYFIKQNAGRVEYKTLKESGPDHGKTFTIGLFYEGLLYGRGSASSKKKAEQIAAKELYSKLCQ